MNKRISIIAGAYHKDLVQGMLTKVEAKCIENGFEIDETHWVPGSLEKPLCAQRIFDKGVANGIVVLGIIERGETKHGLVIGEAVVKSLIDLQLQFKKPIGLGILGPEIFPSQISSRLTGYAEAAAMAVINDPSFTSLEA